MAQEKAISNPLATEPMGKLMLRFCVPSVISILVNMLYNLVDQIFIGQGVGYLGNAATNIIMPLTTVIMSIGQLFGCGCVAYASLNFGKGDTKKANEGVGTVITTTVILGIILAVIFEIFMSPLCKLFGATADSLPYALDYGRIVAVGFPFFISTTVFTNIFRADGRPSVSMIGMLIGFVTNMIFDPVFIFLFHWGVKGAALATIMGQIFNALYYYWNLGRCKTFQFHKKDFFIKPRIIGSISWLGVSAFVTQIETVFVQLVGNNLLVHYGTLSKYGPDIPMAAYGITMKLLMLVSGVATGIIMGAQPILGYNYGSKQFSRVKKCYKDAVLVSTLVLIVAFLVFEFAPEAVVSLFGQESALYEEFAVKALRIFMCLCPIVGFCVITPVFFQSIGKPIPATILSICRQLVFLTLAMVAMTSLMGVEGILWAGPISNALAAILSAVMLIYQWKRIFKEGI